MMSASEFCRSERRAAMHDIEPFVTCCESNYISGVVRLRVKAFAARVMENEQSMTAEGRAN